jgi:hypothetical protein
MVIACHRALQHVEISLKSYRRPLPLLFNEPMPDRMMTRAKMLRLKWRAIQWLAPARRD